MSECWRCGNDHDKSSAEWNLLGHLCSWRAERPDEWKMDEFIHMAKKDNSDLLAAQVEAARLREALKPFAEAFEKHGKFIYDHIQGDEELIDINDQNQIHPRGTTMGDYRRAFEALAPKDPS